MPIRRALAVLHRWIGLASGAIVFVVALTGAVYVWEGELFALTHRDLVYVDAGAVPLAPSVLLAAARGALPADRPVERLTIFADERRAAVASAQRTDAGARTYFGELRYFDEVYLDPGSAQVLGVVDRKFEWLHLTRALHTSLLLSTAGSWIVGGATLVFVAMVLTGLILWWPRNRAVLAVRLRPRLTASWKRAVFDGHNVLGFYGLAGLLVVALTGPVWTWRWYTNAIAWTLTGEARLVAQPVPTPPPLRASAAAADPLERALRETRRRVPDATRYTIELSPDSSRVLTVGAVFDRSSLWEEYERYYYHPASGALLGDERFEEKNLAMKWRNSNYGIHTGTLLGWPMQLVASTISLLAASLPVTGALIWYPRWRRGRRRAAEGRREGAGMAEVALE